MTPAPAGHPEGRLEGRLEAVGPAVTGWAWLPGEPGRRLRVVVRFSGAAAEAPPGAGSPQAVPLKDGGIEVETLADLPRGDLADAGKGDGRHGFAVPVPPSFAGREHRVEVRLPGFPEARLNGAPRRSIATLWPVVLRPVQPDGPDVDRLRAFLGECANLNGGVAGTAVPAADTVRVWLRGTGGGERCWLVAERNGGVVGHCRIGPGWPAAHGSGGLSLGIELHPDVQGFGLGRHLMGAAHRWAAGRCARLELAVLPHNTRALALYRGFGYRDVGTAILPETGESHRHMALPLPAGRWSGGLTLIV